MSASPPLEHLITLLRRDLVYAVRDSQTGELRFYPRGRPSPFPIVPKEDAIKEIERALGK